MADWFRNTLVLAPICDYTNRPFRRLCREFGADVVVTEMLSADALVHGGLPTLKMLQFGDDERPVGAQLHGHDPVIMAAAAQIAAAAGVDFVDINAGCPQRKVVNSGNGAALLKDLPLLARILKTVRASIECPMTVKVRIGWDEQHRIVDDIGRLAEDCGCDAIVVHGRTRAQMFAGQADWAAIAKIKARVGIPVVGNGDVRNRADWLSLREQTGCDAVMVGRGALGAPWIFQSIKGERVEAPGTAELRAIILRHVQYYLEYTDERQAALQMRKHLIHYTRGLPYSADLRRSLATVVDRVSLCDVLDRLLTERSHCNQRTIAAVA